MWKNVVRTIDNYFPYLAVLVMAVLLTIVLYQTYGPVNGTDTDTGPEKVTQTNEAPSEMGIDSIVNDSVRAHPETIGTENTGELAQ